MDLCRASPRRGLRRKEFPEVVNALCSHAAFFGAGVLALLDELEFSLDPIRFYR